MEDNDALKAKLAEERLNEQDLELENLVDLLIMEGNLSESTSLSNETIPRDQGKIVIRKPKKGYRKPPFKTAFIPSLRIIRRDIRRKYLDMLCNVMNSHDERLYGSFLKDFFSPECVATHSCMDFINSNSTCLDLTGIASMRYLYAVGWYMKPDAILRITNVKICKRLHENGSRILANVTSEATMLYTPKDPALTKLQFFEKLKDRQWSRNVAELENMNDLIDPNEFQLEVEPKKIKVHGTATILLDELHRVIRMAFHCSLGDITPAHMSRMFFLTDLTHEEKVPLVTST